MSVTREVSALAGLIGKGLIAGFIGTIAITGSQMIEMKLTGRSHSDEPAEAADKVLGVEPKGEEGKERFSNAVHFGYGTVWGVVRGFINACGIKGPAASVIHCLAVSGAAMTMLPALKVSPPVRKWSAQQIAADSLHHAIYAAVVGLVYDALDKADE